MTVNVVSALRDVTSVKYVLTVIEYTFASLLSLVITLNVSLVKEPQLLYTEEAVIMLKLRVPQKV